MVSLMSRGSMEWMLHSSNLLMTSHPMNWDYCDVRCTATAHKQSKATEQESNHRLCANTPRPVSDENSGATCLPLKPPRCQIPSRELREKGQPSCYRGETSKFSSENQTQASWQVLQCIGITRGEKCSSPIRATQNDF